MTTELILHLLNEILQMSKCKFFFSRVIFPRIVQTFLKYANV